MGMKSRTNIGWNVHSCATGTHCWPFSCATCQTDCIIDATDCTPVSGTYELKTDCRTDAVVLMLEYCKLSNSSM